ncbi:hypothetical protein NMG60_11025076 [Bertholletia excelsa]
MVGLSIVLEPQNGTDRNVNRPQVINKATMAKPSSPSAAPSLPPFTGAGFLDRCFLCRQKLLPGKDIYMYKGDRGFCSVECRCKQMFMDDHEEETGGAFSSTKDNCSMAAMKAPRPTSPTSRTRKGAARNRANGFAY